MAAVPFNFPSPKELRKHTRRHWAEFGLASEHDQVGYLALAVAFCGGACPNDAEECVREKCDNMIDRFREISGEFAVLMPDRSAIVTYHILHPIQTVGVPVQRTHRYATNREYFNADCECLT